MTVVSATGVAQAFGAHDIFSGVTISVPPGGKIGLVGPNGVGKTTLLLILAGKSTPSSGTVTRARGARIGYLPQEAEDAFTTGDRSVEEVTVDVFSTLIESERELRDLEHSMAASGGDEEVLQRYGKLQEKFELAGGYEYRTRTKRVLGGLGFDAEARRQPISQLSGGQKTRALLAQLLLSEPDLLILDEPTNHLDVEALQWLEGILAEWAGALVAVSHDRYFLDSVCDTIWELRPSGIERFRGNYSSYVQQRGERWVRRRKEFVALKDRMAHELDFIKRNMASQRTSMAQGKLARLGREVEAFHAGGIEAMRAIESKGWLQATADLVMERPGATVGEVEQRVGEMRLEVQDPLVLGLDLTPRERGGDFVIRSRELTVGYGSRPLFEADDLELMRGECAALMGGNGTGKTTFLKTLLGEVPPLSGDIRMGANLATGYFAQSHDTFDPSRSILDEFMEASGMRQAEARSYLARFLFRGDDVFKRVASLSGGELARLALSLLSREGANLLLLDEPTNHLDIPSQEVLQSVLQQFEGTILLVSHDRYLVDRLATQIWELSDGRLRVFPGPYGEFLAAKQEASAEGESRPRTRAGRERRAAKVGADPPALSKNEMRRLEERRTAAEARIAALESQLSDLTRQIEKASEKADVDRINKLVAAYDSAKADLDEAYEEWAEVG